MKGGVAQSGTGCQSRSAMLGEGRLCRAVQEFLVAAVHQKRSTLEGPGFKLAGWRAELGLDKCPTRVLPTRLLLPGRSRWQWAIDVGPGGLAGFGWFLEGRQASNLCRAAEDAQGRIQKTRPSLGDFW